MALRTISMILILAGAVYTKTSETNGDDCPWQSHAWEETPYCCFGAIIWEDPDNGIGNCCVKDLRNEDDPCVTEVAFDDPDYSSIVSAASKSIMADASTTNTAETTTTETQSTKASATATATGNTKVDSDGNVIEGEDGGEGAGAVLTSNLMAIVGSAVIAALFGAL